MTLIENPKNEVCDVIFLTNTENLDIFQMTSNAIQSLRESESNNRFRIIVVESRTEITRLVPGEDHNYNSDLTIYYKGEFNYNKALNMAFEHIENDHVAVFNNDVLFTPGWYSAMRYNMDVFNLDSASPHCPVKQQGPNELAQRTILSYQPSTVIAGYNCITEFCGWGWMMKKSVLEKLLPFPEDLSFWFQDNHMALQLKTMGYKHGYVVDSVVIHFGQKSYSLISPDKIHGMTHGLHQTFINKWIK